MLFVSEKNMHQVGDLLFCLCLVFYYFLCPRIVETGSQPGLVRQKSLTVGLVYFLQKQGILVKIRLLRERLKKEVIINSKNSIVNLMLHQWLVKQSGALHACPVSLFQGEGLCSCCHHDNKWFRCNIPSELTKCSWSFCSHSRCRSLGHPRWFAVHHLGTVDETSTATHEKIRGHWCSCRVNSPAECRAEACFLLPGQPIQHGTLHPSGEYVTWLHHVVFLW